MDSIIKSVSGNDFSSVLSEEFVSALDTVMELNADLIRVSNDHFLSIASKTLFCIIDTNLSTFSSILNLQQNVSQNNNGLIALVSGLHIQTR